MAQKPGFTVPLRHRLAVQAELLTWRATLPPKERSETAMGASLGVSQTLVGRALKGLATPAICEGVLQRRGLTMEALLAKHQQLIARVENCGEPTEVLVRVIEGRPTVENAAMPADAAQEAARALAEDEGLSLPEAKSIALDMLSEDVEPNALAIYRAARRSRHLRQQRQ